MEELELCQYYSTDVTWIIKLFATASPNLKHFKHVKLQGGYHAHNREALAIGRMHGLRSLQLVHGDLDNEGLTTILDNCPHMESLDLRLCDNVVIDSSLRAKCDRIKTKKLYPYAYDDFTKYFVPSIPVRHCSSCRVYHNDGDEHDCQFLCAYHDFDDSDHPYYFSRAEETDIEEHDRSFGKGTRRCRRRFLRI